MNKVRQLLKESLTGGLYQMTLSGAAGEATGCSKKKIRPVLLKDRLLFQITAYRGTQVFHENHTAEEAAAILEADLSGSFKQLQVETTSFEATVLVSKKGKMTVRKKQRSVSEDNVKVSLSHNRKKRYILEEGRGTISSVRSTVFWSLLRTSGHSCPRIVRCILLTLAAVSLI